MPADKYASLPFAEQIDFFLKKLNVPTAAWSDFLEGQHNYAFTVAGAARDDMLSDLRKAVDKAINDGVTIQDFRRDFDDIVARYGWAHHGNRNWRSRVIYETNLYSSYAAGRLEQLQTFPYWQYKHSHAVVMPRPEHEAWDGLTLPANDSWWKTHFPPNGYGCQCTVRGLTRGDMDRKGISVDAPPNEGNVTHIVGSRSGNPKAITTPRGVDPGFQFMPGKLRPVTPGRAVPVAGPGAKGNLPKPVKPPTVTAKTAASALLAAAGVPAGGGYVVAGAQRVAVNAETALDGMSVRDAVMVGTAMKAPAEVWISIDERGTVRRHISAFKHEGHTLFVVVEFVKGEWSYVVTRYPAPYRFGERV